MKTVYDIRRENLTRLLEPQGAKTALAIKLGYSNGSRVTHLLNATRPIHEDTARAIENAIGLTPGELDREPGAPPVASHIDFDLLIDAVTVAIDYMRSEGLPADKAKATRLSKAIYAYAKEAGSINVAAIRPLLKALL
jgi:hypothetical protein